MSDSMAARPLAKKERVVRDYTLGEEIANSVIHGLGIGLSVAALVILVAFAVLADDGFKLASAIVIFGFVIVQLFPATIIRLFINDPDLIRVGTFGISVFLSMLPLLGFQIVATNYFQSVGKAKLAIFGSMLRQVIILLPLYLILPRIYGLPGVWFASPIADFLSFVIALLLIGFEMKKLPRTALSEAHSTEPEITAG